MANTEDIKPRRLEAEGEMDYDYVNDVLFFKVKERDYSFSMEFQNMVIDIDEDKFVVGIQIFGASEFLDISRVDLREIPNWQFKAKVYYIGVEIPAVEDVGDVVVVTPSSSGGGGRGGSYVCVEDWSCGEWGECVGNRQSRDCVDVQMCGQENDRPETYRGCDYGSGSGGGLVVEEDEVVGEKVGFVSRVTGGVVGVVGSTGGMAVAGVFVLVVLGGFFAMRVRSRSVRD